MDAGAIQEHLELLQFDLARELKSEVVYGELRREVEGGGGFS